MDKNSVVVSLDNDKNYHIEYALNDYTYMKNMQKINNACFSLIQEAYNRVMNGVRSQVTLKDFSPINNSTVNDIELRGCNLDDTMSIANFVAILLNVRNITTRF